MSLDIDYDFYLRKDLWSDTDITKIFAHLLPTDLAQLFELIDASTEAETLWNTLSKYDLKRLFHPFKFIEWAILYKVKSIPAELQLWYLEQTISKPQNEFIEIPTPPYLDTNHPLHSPELKIAIDAWLAVLENNPERGNVGSRKGLIEDWLDINYPHPKLSGEAKSRIAGMLNPDKAGGAPKTQK
jgi:hypothetical protein